MITYVVGDTEIIEELNHEEAVKRNCSGTTYYWYETRLTASGELAMIVSDEADFSSHPGFTPLEPVWDIEPAGL